MPDRIPPTRKPTRAELAAAAALTVPDVIAPGLRVLFCGINPGLYTAAVGRHFARPGNRFWPALHRSGFTPRLLSPFEERELLSLGLGVTNVVARATTFVMPQPCASSSRSSKGESCRGVKPERWSAGQKRLPGRAKWRPTAAV